MAKHDCIPMSYLRECFDCDAENGTLTWRERPLEHFATENAYRTWNTRFAGQRAGWNNDQGYLLTTLTFEGKTRHIRTHRIIFAMVRARWPAKGLDHKNRIAMDNRLGNLREATQSQNLQNKGMQNNNTSGYTGACWDKSRKKWIASIRIPGTGRNLHLGRFSTPEAAHAVYLAAQARYHPFHPN